jgi:hypothetical protein
MDWSRRLRIMEKVAVPDGVRDAMIMRKAAPPAQPAPPMPAAMTHSETGQPYRTQVARQLASARMRGTVGNTPTVAPTTEAVAPEAVTTAAKPAPLVMKGGRGYSWLAHQINKGRESGQKIRWQDLRKAMGQQVLHPGAKHDYGKLRGLTPEALREANASKKYIAMDWHKDQDDLKRDMATGKRLYRRRTAGLAAARESKRQQAANREIERQVLPAAPAAAPAPAPVAAAPIVAPAANPAGELPAGVSLPEEGYGLSTNQFGRVPLRMMNPDARRKHELAIALANQTRRIKPLALPANPQVAAVAGLPSGRVNFPGPLATRTGQP